MYFSVHSLAFFFFFFCNMDTIKLLKVIAFPHLFLLILQRVIRGLEPIPVDTR